MRNQTTVSVTTSTESQYFIPLRLGARTVRIPVSSVVHTHWGEQFRTEGQKRRKLTAYNMMAAAYKKGYEDGQSLGQP